MKCLLIALPLAFLPLAGAPPAKKPAAAKKSFTLDTVMMLSAIKDYTDTEDALLESLRKNPERTRVQLLKIHERRLKSLDGFYDYLTEQFRNSSPGTKRASQLREYMEQCRFDMESLTAAIEALNILAGK